jgi:hypothetical protein
LQLVEPVGLLLFICVSGIGVLGMVAIVREVFAPRRREKRASEALRRQFESVQRLATTQPPRPQQPAQQPTQPPHPIIPVTSISSVLKKLEDTAPVARIEAPPILAKGSTRMPRAAERERLPAPLVTGPALRAPVPPLPRARTAAGSTAPPLPAPRVAATMPVPPVRPAAIPPPFRPRSR